MILAAADRVAGRSAYRRAPQARPIDLRLDANEGRGPDGQWLEDALRQTVASVGAYPDASALETLLAERWLGARGGDTDAAARVVVTAGADDALARICQAWLQPGRRALLTSPTFEMIERYIRLSGGDAVPVPWLEGPFPTRAMLACMTADTALVFIVSPNNPTGGVAEVDDLTELSAAAAQVGALVVLDGAYAEFADADLTPAALQLPNVIVVRTFSKAWGLAGLRVGYAIAPTAACAGFLRAVGQPYAVSGVSLAVAQRCLREGEAEQARAVARVRQERARLTRTLQELGTRPIASQANLVLTRFGRGGAAAGAWAADALAGLGIAVRRYDTGELAGMVRVSCPGDEAALERLEGVLRSALRPEALLFDLDGVLADVSQSYRRAIVETCALYGVDLGPADVAAAKAAGNANNDWVLTQRLLAARGINRPLAEVTAAFERPYHGDGTRPGLCANERLLTTRAFLDGLRKRLPLAIVTGRPRADAEAFLRAHGIEDCFSALICMEDGPPKPDPAVVHLALARLNVRYAWMIGDTVDDVRAARSAAVVPIGVCPPGEVLEQSRHTLTASGAARVLANVEELTGLLDLTGATS
ncbi:MAG: TIGR01548 family HAD-type hydrolase [Phycisphaerales bacterium]